MDFPDIIGFMGPIELQWLYETAHQMTSVVEVGSWKGRSTIVLATACPGTVYAVDHFLGSPSERDSTHAEAKVKDIHKIFLENTKPYTNIVCMKMDSAVASSKFGNKSIDMIFIDGSHTYDDVVTDISCWLPKCRKVICGHDFDHQEVKNAIKDCGLNATQTAGTIWEVWLNGKG